MTGTSDVPPSKGMMMIAAYRAARLRQRPTLRTSLHESDVALKATRCQGQAAGEPACATTMETPAPTPVAAASPEATEPALVFASLVNLAVSDKQAEMAEAPADTAQPVEQDLPPEVAAVAPPDNAAADNAVDDALPAPQESVRPIRHDPPLAEIGFGSGMIIRLSQLGLRTTGDLAQANANELRAALGDISRLVDVEAWIASARMTASTFPTDDVTASEICT